MRRPILLVIGAFAVILAVIVLLRFAVADQTSTPTAGLKTPWGEPNLQGIWTDEHQTPLQ